MKLRLLITGAICAMAFTVNAQTEKGNQLIGGSIGFVTLDNDQGSTRNKQRSYSIGPNYGYFIADNFALGLNANYGYNKMFSSYETTIAFNGTLYPNIVAQESKSNSSNVGVFARYYVNINNDFKFFGQFNAGVGFGRDRNYQRDPSTLKSTTYNASVSPSVAFFPTKKLAIELGFGLISYTNTMHKSGDSSYYPNGRTEIFNFGFNTFEPKLGINLHF
ncbi:MAG: hypothetical protein EOO47_07235 [Flavobacterium sp.]|nr:MAG: hypothetical protein EOO47_07235 [Flavobacterium sp.]